MSTQNTEQSRHIKDSPAGAAYGALSLFSGASEAQRVVCATWSAHTYIYRQFAATPRLDFAADMPGTGKTVNMQVTCALSANHLVLGYESQASLYSWLDQHPDTTFGLDEIDKALGEDGRKTSRAILAAVVNDGYQANGHVLVNRSSKAVLIPVFVPVALAGLGRLPFDTETRSAVIHLAKVTPAEVYLPPIHDPELALVGAGLKEWLTSRTATDYLTSQPRIASPAVGADPRYRLIMAPLEAIASLGGYREQFTDAVREIQSGIAEHPPTPLYGLLLADLREAWPADGPAMADSAQIITWLRSHEMERWRDLQVGRIGDVTLANLLRQAGVPSRTSNGRRGYRRSDVFPGGDSK